MRFKTGDRVRCIKNPESSFLKSYDNSIMIGKEGIIVQLRTEEPSVGVYFDENVNGHNLNGACPIGHGYYFYEDCLIKVKNNSISKWFD